MKPLDRRGGEAGFTLVETLVTLAVVGFLVLLTSTILHSASSTLRAMSRADADSDARSSITTFLRRVLAHAQPDLAARDGKGLSTFVGHPMRVQFLASSDGREGVSDIVRYDLHNDDRGRLHVAWRLDRPAGQEALTADDVVPEARILGFFYFGSDGGTDAPRWMDRWRDQDELPTAVRLSVEIAGRSSDILASPVIGHRFASER